ncbi:MAG: U32 family peptidase [Burkholderiales bacterium]|nr:U32 family peptidase [Phycisphaerae bacterium]
MSPSVITKQRPELLSPAGDWDALRAAVSNGADAVYFGLETFNARFRAHNFTLEELHEVMDFLHRHGAKGFLTFNTLIFSDELEQATEYIRAMAAAGVDAVIVQDLGIARLIHQMAPTLPIHGSTQMTLTEPRGIEFVRKLGVSRVVLAREMSVDDVSKIIAGTDMPVEVFIHGALCVAYSGQCLTSESLGGRSANRGHCAQACRLPYDLIVDGQKREMGDVNYLVSPQDLAGYDQVGRLANIGVKSFKIEGRLKTAHYVAATTQTYRAAIDAAIVNQAFRISPEQKGDLEQVFSRGFAPGFLDGVNHQRLVQGRFPKSRGRRVGTVVQRTGTGIIIKPDGDAELKAGDGVVFDEGHPERDERGGRLYNTSRQSRGQVLLEFGRHELDPMEVALGAIVWKTDDPAVRRRLDQSFAKDRIVHRTPIDMTVIARTGQRLRLTATDGEHNVFVESESPLPKADKFPATEKLLQDQLGMLATTPFSLRNLHCTIDGDPITPKPVLADVRRRAVEGLIERRKRSHELLPLPAGEGWGEGAANFQSASTEQSPLTLTLSHREREPELYILARTVEQVEALIALEPKPSLIYCDFEDVRRYKIAVDLCRAASVTIAVATMRITKPGEEGWLQQILDTGPDQILVRNLAAIEFYKEKAPQLPLIGDYALNVANHLTAAVFKDAGLARVVPSYDLNWKQMSAMLANSDPSFYECVVHQHMPMFHMEHCVFAHTLSNGKDFRDCGRPCEKHQVDLRDRMGQPHPLIPDAGCRNTLYNAAAQSGAEYIPKMRELGISHYRVELLRQKPTDVAPLIQKYRDILSGQLDATFAVRSLRVLNQLGVTRGTLDRE